MRVEGSVIALAACVCSCALVVSFDDYSTAVPLYGVSGTVSGLEGAQVTLLLDDAHGIVAGDGAFRFPKVLRDGASFTVSTLADPEGHRCAVDRGQGRITGADAGGVVVTCPSSVATLADLRLSAAPLLPAFDPGRLSYASLVYFSGIFDDIPPSTSLVARPTDPRATVRSSGQLLGDRPSAPFPILPGTNVFDIDVTAVDGTVGRYGVTLRRSENAYLKSSKPHKDDYFAAIAIDGDTLAVGAYGEASGSTTDANDRSMPKAGAVYVFMRTAGTWIEQAYVKPSTPRAGAQFGQSVALSGDTLVVGAIEDSSRAPKAGLAYVFERRDGKWTQVTELAASNPRANALFGSPVAISGDTIAIGSLAESSAARGVDGDESDTSAPLSGAVYVFARSGGRWSKQAYLKASNNRNFTQWTNAQFGNVAIHGDALVVGALSEASGVATSETDTSAPNAGAAYVFRRSAGRWSQEAYLKSPYPWPDEYFGSSVAIFEDTIAIGAVGDRSTAKGVGGDPRVGNLYRAGAAHVFARVNGSWSRQAYVKASNTNAEFHFGSSVALGRDTLAVASSFESSRGVGVNGDQTMVDPRPTGATYVFVRKGTAWSQRAYVKASNPAFDAYFAYSLGLSGRTLVVGAPGESSAASGIDGDPSTTGVLPFSGAVYVY